jgi:hypothetical protein
LQVIGQSNALSCGVAGVQDREKIITKPPFRNEGPIGELPSPTARDVAARWNGQPLNKRRAIDRRGQNPVGRWCSAPLDRDDGLPPPDFLAGGGSSCLLVNGKETIKPSDPTGQRPVPAVFFVK